MATLAELKARFNKKDNKIAPLFAIVLGPRGYGKSSLGGTFKKKTLQLYTNEENHSVAAAQAVATSDYISSICLNADETGELVYNAEKHADKILSNLHDILSTEGLEKEFNAIVLDGLSSLDIYINASKEVSGASKYDVTKITKTVYNRLINKLKTLHAKGMDVLVTCSSETVIDNGKVMLVPKLRGSGVVDEAIGSFFQVLSIGPITIEDPETGESVVHRALQFGTGVNFDKSGKKMTGQTNCLSFKPRLAGLPDKVIPDVMPADLAKLKKFMEDKFTELRTEKKETK